jgi:hypothetical protein
MAWQNIMTYHFDRETFDGFVYESVTNTETQSTLLEIIGRLPEYTAASMSFENLTRQAHDDERMRQLLVELIEQLDDLTPEDIDGLLDFLQLDLAELVQKELTQDLRLHS